MNAAAKVLKGLVEIKEELENLYLELHQNPELSMQETETTTHIATLLEKFGFATTKIGGGVVGILENGAGPTVLYRADIDGLPVKEATKFSYASTKTQVDRDGVTQPTMHACGHDIHITAGIGAAQLLAAAKEEWSGTYIALFQPGEETAEGAKSMVDAGLKDLLGHIDVALGQHVLTSPAAGMVGTTAGPFLSTAASMKITLVGKGSHGSMPHLGIDPIVLAAAIVMRLQGIVAREISPSDFAVVTVGSLQAGTKANIIPNEATLLINVRAYSNEIRQQLIAAIKRIVQAECLASRCPEDPRFEIFDEYPLTDNSSKVNEKIRAAFIDYFGAERVAEMSPLTASEDFSIIPDAFEAPYLYWGLGGFSAEEPTFPNHNPKFGPAIQPTLNTGVAAAVVAILSYLGNE